MSGKELAKLIKINQKNVLFTVQMLDVFLAMKGKEPIALTEEEIKQLVALWVVWKKKPKMSVDLFVEMASELLKGDCK